MMGRGITVDQMIGTVKVKDISETDAYGNGFKYFMNETSIFLQFSHELDLDKTKKEKVLCFKKRDDYNYELLGDYLIIGYWYNHKYPHQLNKERNDVDNFLNCIKEIYIKDKKRWI